MVSLDLFGGRVIARPVLPHLLVVLLGASESPHLRAVGFVVAGPGLLVGAVQDPLDALQLSRAAALDGNLGVVHAATFRIAGRAAPAPSRAEGQRSPPRERTRLVATCKLGMTYGEQQGLARHLLLLELGAARRQSADQVIRAAALLLAGRAAVVLPDLPQGAHRHAVPDRSRLHADGIADALADVLEAVGGGPAVVVGNDNGGAMSQVFAARHPDRVAGLVLAGCEVLEHFPPRAFAPFVAGARWPATLTGFARLLRIPALLADPGRVNIFTVRGFGRSYVHEITTGVLDDYEVRDDLAAFIRSLRPEVLLRASRPSCRWTGRTSSPQPLNASSTPSRPRAGRPPDAAP